MRPQVGSASKLLSVTGWRVGWVTGPQGLIQGVNMVHQHATVCAPAPLQAGVAAALDGGLDGNAWSEGAVVASSAVDFSRGVGAVYESNFRCLEAAFEGFEGVVVCPAEGGYFCVVDVAGTGLTDLDFTRRLLRDAKVGGMPMSAFYVPAKDRQAAPVRSNPSTLVRFAVCKSPKVVREAASRIQRHLCSL